jgi:hypothetical protein
LNADRVPRGQLWREGVNRVRMLCEYCGAEL